MWYICGEKFLKGKIMPTKPYQTKESVPMSVAEPVAAYQTAAHSTPPPAVKMWEDDGFRLTHSASENPSPSGDSYFTVRQNMSDILESSQQARCGKFAVTLQTAEDISKYLGLR
jgi:hypothetical protein